MNAMQRNGTRFRLPTYDVLIAPPVIRVGSMLGLGLAVLIAHAASARQPPQIDHVPRPEVFVPDRPVEVIEAYGNRVYVGGRFSAFGPFTGPFATPTIASGPVAPNWPPMDGEVHDVESDGNGGWFLAGSFSLVGDQPRDGLARLLPSGALDPWAPSLDGEALALEFESGVLYVGGRFVTAAGQARNSLAAFDSSLQLLPWNPAVGASFASFEGIHCLAAHGGVLYAGGFFNTTFSGFLRRNLIAISQASGTITPFDPSPNGKVNDLLVDSGTLWIGGNFHSAGGASRSRLAQIDLASGLATAFSIGADNEVRTLARDGALLYVGGAFGAIGGVPRVRCGAIDVSVPAVTAFAPSPSESGNEPLEVSALAVAGGVAYLGGSFRRLDSFDRWHLGAVDAVTGAATSFDHKLAGPVPPVVHDLAVAGNQLAVAGEFTIAGAVQRRGVAALNADTLELLTWAPNVDDDFQFGQPGSVSAFAFSGNTVYVGGSFGYVNGLQRARVAAIDAVTADLVFGFDMGLPLNADGVKNLTITASGLLVDVSRLVNPITGASIGSWSAQTNVPPEAVTISKDGSRIVAGGLIQEAGDGVSAPIAVSNLASFDPTTAIPDSGFPGSDKVVRALRCDPGRILVGGAFDSIAGTLRRRVAELDAGTGALTSFAPVVGGAASSDVLAIASTPSIVFCGGDFTTVNGASYPHLVAIDRSNSQAIFWKPKPDGSVRALAAHRGYVIAGGDFDVLFSGPRTHLAAFDVHSLVTTGSSISVATGGSVTLDIDAGAALAGRSHWLIGSASGTSPGLALPGEHLPLNFDPYLSFGFAQPNNPFLPGGFGVLDGTGNAVAQFVLPAGGPPSIVGIVLRHAAMIYDPIAGKPLFVTNPVATRLDD